jgi:ubiquinone/menaquinone biosynthesis C-methylase UbiE
MSESSQRSGAVGRGRRVYDRWASLGPVYALVDRLSRPIRAQAVAALDVTLGDCALDLGCGPGAGLELLADAVGPTGSVVGVDYSDGMIARARSRATELPVASVVRTDARTLPVASNEVNVAFASLALSAMPDAERVLAEVRRVLEADGTLAVVDGQLPDSPVGRVLEPVYETLVNWQGIDVLDALRETFAHVEVVDTYDAGLGFVATAQPT